MGPGAASGPAIPFITMRAAAGILAVCVMVAGCMRAPPGDFAAIPARSEPVDVAARDPAPASTPPAPKLPRPEALTDPAITANITAAISADPAMAGSDISVNTTHGVVQLTGKVASQEQIAIASAYAQRQDGVMRVDDHLSLPLK